MSNSSQANVSSVGRLYSLLQNQPSPVVLLGAGASIRSGIPLASGFTERAAKWAYAREHGRSDEDPRLQRSDWLPWLRQQPWYNANGSFADNYPAAVQNLLTPRQARKDFFQRLLNPGVQPSAGYDKLAEFLHLGVIRTVLTTNFDSLLSETRTIKRRPHHIDTIQTKADYTKFSTSPPYPQLIHLHGSVDHYTDQNIINEVQNLDPDMVSMLAPLLRDHPLIVVGYRGSEPSVMKHLLIDNAEACNLYRHGIYWCKLKDEANDTLAPFVHDLGRAIGSNFALVNIDGFDELFAQELWGRQQESAFSPPGTALPGTPATPPTTDLTVTGVEGIEELDWATLRTRIIQYCEALQIKTPETADRNWVTEQLFNLNLAIRDASGSAHLTTAGYLLFGKEPQKVISSARVVISAEGPSEWIARAIGEKDIGAETGHNSGKLERVIAGNLWAQYDQINDVLSAFNRPFRLKGEPSVSVVPYPPLALKEIIVNALVHRDYTLDQPVSVEISPNSIRICNPGGLVDEVRRRVEANSIEGEIRRGRRGIKGYRNPVIADLFYGSGEMDKAGSGLADVYREVRDNGGEVSFGPNAENNSFEVTILSRPEVVDQTTGTASPLVVTSARYAANTLQVVDIPTDIFHAGTDVKSVWDIWRALPKQWIPPFILHDGRIYSFHNPESPWNPLNEVVDTGDIETLSVDEFSAGEDGQRRLVWILNLCLEHHLYRRGLIVDKKRKRAYFPRTEEGPHTISYQARLRRAKRTVVKTRVSSRTGKIMYWEHEALSYRFQKFGNTWGLLLAPGYVFTFDGRKGLLSSEKVNKLSTKRAARDYNNAVHNDLSFWVWFLSDGSPSAFPLILGPPPFSFFEADPAFDEVEEDDERWSEVLRHRSRPLPEEDVPMIILDAQLPTVVVSTAELSGEVEETESPDDELEELEEEVAELADESRRIAEESDNADQT